MHMEWDCIDVVIFLEDFLVSEFHEVTKVNVYRQVTRRRADCRKAGFESASGIPIVVENEWAPSRSRQHIHII